MSVYNGERFLAEAVESILAQTFTDFEFVIVDDGSKDSTAEILAGYAKRDSRVRVISQENTGRSEALNRGFRLARAPLIARMDADDIALPTRFEQQHKFMRAHPRVALLGGQAERIAPDARSLGPYNAQPTNDAEIRRGMLHFSMFVHPTVMMARDLVLQLGGYRKALPEAEDYDLFLRISEHAQVANLPQQVLRYRMHTNQASVRAMGLQTQCCLAAKAAATLRKQGLPDPLADATEFNGELLRGLGITDEEQREEELLFCRTWMEVLRGIDADSTLGVIERYVHLCDAKQGQSGAAANALMMAASICYRGGEITRAASYVGRSLAAHPGVVARHLKMAAARRVRRSPAQTRPGTPGPAQDSAKEISGAG